MGAMRNLTAAVVARARNGSRHALDLILPPLCPGCGRLADRVHALCGRCWREVAWIDRPVCDRLGTPLPFAAESVALSAAALADPPAWGRARAAARYDGVGRDLVHAFKYGDHRELASILAVAMARAGRDLLADADLIVPVPLHRLRLLHRKFNQSAVLAQAIGRLTAKPVATGLLVRQKRTRQQVGLSASERRRNVGGAFVVPDAARVNVREKRILLVDDVLTSGATLAGCSRALVRAGAANVDVLVFARVVAAT